jgi:hypothetical protein
MNLVSSVITDYLHPNTAIGAKKVSKLRLEALLAKTTVALPCHYDSGNIKIRLKVII